MAVIWAWTMVCLVRGVNYFPDASALHEWVVLLAWTVAGLLFSILGHFRSTTPVTLPESELEQPVGAASVA